MSQTRKGRKKSVAWVEKIRQTWDRKREAKTQLSSSGVAVQSSVV